MTWDVVHSLGLCVGDVRRVGKAGLELPARDDKTAAPQRVTRRRVHNTLRTATAGALRLGRAAVLVLGLLGSLSVGGAERFGDILVIPQSIFAGETRRGYLEHRLVLINESATKSHAVRIACPAQQPGPTPYGLRSMTREARLSPGSTVMLRLWQPAVPIWGSDYAVYVDREYQGNLGESGPRYGHGHGHHVGSSTDIRFRTYLISRSFNADDLGTRLEELEGAPFSATQATGPPNVMASDFGKAWVPTFRGPGTPEWIELVYEPPIVAHRVQIHYAQPQSAAVKVALIGADGVELTSRSDPSPAPTYLASSRDWLQTLEFTPPSQPVARVRLELTPPLLTPPLARGSGSIGNGVMIDAVELAGLTSRAWAREARASSQGTAPTGPTSAPYSKAMLTRYGLIPGTTSFGHIPGASSSSFGVVRSELEPALWSDQWLIYTPFDLVLITARDFEAMPEPARVALWRYVECGGALATLGPIPVPDPWRVPEQPLEGGTSRTPVGFGHCLMFEQTALNDLPQRRVRELSDLAARSGQPWVGLEHQDVRNAHSDFPVIDEIRMPFRGLSLLLLAFVVIIGPVNLIVLARFKRRLWSLWTVPAFSLVTCAAIFAYSVLHEGVSPYLRVEGVTLLDQVNHRASSLGMAAYYCPLTPGDGLRFSPDTELTPMGVAYYGEGQVAVDWTDGQHLYRGWISPRLPTVFRTRRSETRRERLELVQDDAGQPAVVNGLGAPIQTLVLTDFSGHTLRASNLPPGQQVPLESVSAPGARAWAPDTLSDLYRGSAWVPAVRVWELLSTNRPPRGAYVARLEGAPFLEPGLRGKTRARQEQVVVGLFSP